MDGREELDEEQKIKLQVSRIYLKIRNNLWIKNFEKNLKYSRVQPPQYSYILPRPQRRCVPFS